MSQPDCFLPSIHQAVHTMLVQSSGSELQCGFSLLGSQMPVWLQWCLRAALTAPLEEEFEQCISVHGLFPCGGFQAVPQPQEFWGRLFLIQIPPTEKQSHLAHRVKTRPSYATPCQAASEYTFIKHMKSGINLKGSQWSPLIWCCSAQPGDNARQIIVWNIPQHLERHLISS